MARRRTALRFRCPNCFRSFEKDDSILMLVSGAAIQGDGIRWSGELDREIDRIKRVKYCSVCHQPLDFHALLRGQLDERGYAVLASFYGALGSLGVFVFVLDLSWWASLTLAGVSSVLLGRSGRYLEERRLARWRLSDEAVDRLGNS